MRQRHRQQNQHPETEQDITQVELTQAAHPDVHNAPSGPGERLKLARKTLNLSIEEIAASLRITRNRIIDIENDDYSGDIALTFIRGYLRSYAKLVDISPDEIIIAFDALVITSVQQQPLLKQAEQRIPKLSRQTWYWVGAAAMVIVLLILFSIWRIQVNSDPTQLSQITPTLLGSEPNTPGNLQATPGFIGPQIPAVGGSAS